MVTASSSPPILVAEATQALLNWAVTISDSDATYFHKSRALAVRLGAHYLDNGLTEFGFWTPELTMDMFQAEESIFLEVFTPLEPVDFRIDEQQIRWRRDCIPLALQGEYTWGVIEGLQPGTRETAGSFYWLRYIDNQGQTHVIRDVLAYSLPYGVFAPAELYDMQKVQRERADLNYFAETGERLSIPVGSLASELSDRLPPRMPAPTCILQIHVGTASPERTLEGLTAIYSRISQKLVSGEPLTLGEQNYVGYDAVQLLPIEPTIEHRPEVNQSDFDFFVLPENIEALQISEPHELTITLRRSNTQNWGYDVPILGAAAASPAILGSLRPDELADFTATLHNFPQGPIQVIYDLVYGHADNQCEKLIHRQFLKGPNMYGQDLNHQLPTARAILLELQRRKLNTGADGVRIDGAQDFRFFNPLSGRVEQDDAYLLAMSDVIQDVAGYKRLMFTIFEDGRPWPEEGWEENSRYREMIEQKPESYQWGPLIFAHNSPTLKNFWDYKWPRVREVMSHGDHWITGCANHDTVRRGIQLDPKGPINWHLGETLPEVLKNAYDNPATKLWVFGFSPGLPMDFLNSNFRGAWGFMRNTDDLFGVKVVSEEVGFLNWQLTPELFQSPQFFPRLKAMGFDKLDVLHQFGWVLASSMREAQYLEDVVVGAVQTCLGEDGVCQTSDLLTLKQLDPPQFLKELDVYKLQKFAKAFMEDAYEFSNVSHWASQLVPERVAFNLALRQYRFAHPWLRENLTTSDCFDRLYRENSTLFYGHRTQPLLTKGDVLEEVIMVANMAGEPVTVSLSDLFPVDFSQWQVALLTPGLDIGISQGEPDSFELRDSQGVLLEKIKLK